jgi:hypothetical protein
VSLAWDRDLGVDQIPTPLSGTSHTGVLGGRHAVSGENSSVVGRVKAEVTWYGGSAQHRPRAKKRSPVVATADPLDISNFNMLRIIYLLGTAYAFNPVDGARDLTSWWRVHCDCWPIVRLCGLSCSLQCGPGVVWSDWYAVLVASRA